MREYLKTIRRKDGGIYQITFLGNADTGPLYAGEISLQDILLGMEIA
jgi:hypothetical protein